MVDLTAFCGKSDSRVSAAIVLEIDRSSVVWEFDSKYYPEFYGASVQGND